jgi:hypothetical protein
MVNVIFHKCWFQSGVWGSGIDPKDFACILTDCIRKEARGKDNGYKVRLAAASVKAEAEAKKVQSMQDRVGAMLDGKVIK